MSGKQGGEYVMMVFRRKQIVVLSLVIMVVVAGYLQYTYKQSSDSMAGGNEDAGTAVFVDNPDDGKQAGDAKDAGKITDPEDFFVQARIDRETSRSKDTALLEEITKDESASQESKDNANAQMIKLVETSQQETRIETLIKKEGFEDVLVLFGDDGSIDIVVKANELKSNDVAKIADVASRQANVPMTSIFVRPGK